MGDQLLRPGGGARANCGEGDHVLTELRVGDADHRGLDDGRMGEQRGLDLGREDGIAASQDQLPLAPHDPHEAIRRDADEVARLEPAVLEHRPRLFGGVEIAVHGGRALDP